MTPTESTSEDEREVTFNLDLPQSLHRRLKSIAALRGVTMKAAAVQAIEAWVNA